MAIREMIYSAAREKFINLFTFSHKKFSVAVIKNRNCNL